MTNNELWQVCIQNANLKEVNGLMIQVGEIQNIDYNPEDEIEEIEIVLIYPAWKLLNKDLEDLEILDLLLRSYPRHEEPEGRTYPTLVPVITRESYETILTNMKD